VDDEQTFSNPVDTDSEPIVDNSPRSPVRPAPPPQPLPQRRPPTPAVNQTTPATMPDDPNLALAELRQKMEQVANEFAQGKINRAQFNAMYGRYGEQRTIIERLIERNPDSKAWKQVVGTAGHTGFLRQHFEAHSLYYLVFRHNIPKPILIGGKTRPEIQEIAPTLKALWSMKTRPTSGLARKPMGDNKWLVLAVGEHAVTLVMYLLEPSTAQCSLVRDLHADFERANRAALERHSAPLERMVFPQRSLVEENL
jgi:hypothetical protein